PHGAHERMRAHRSDRRRPSNSEPRLRTAQELVAAECDDVGACGDRLPHRLFARETEARGVDEGAAAQVVDECDAALVSERPQRPVLWPRDESRELEVARVHAEDRAGPLGDRGRVVTNVGAVRGPDLDELRTGTAKHVRDAETAADL